MQPVQLDSTPPEQPAIAPSLRSPAEVDAYLQGEVSPTEPPPSALRSLGQRRLPLGNIQRDSRAQPREKLNAETVEAYREAMVGGTSFPAVVVFGKEDTFFLADGFHRVEAALLAEREDILAEVREGGLREAILFSVGANATHGLPRTHLDKRRAVLTLLEDEEWSRRSDRWVAGQALVDHKTVARWRAELESKNSSGEFPQLAPEMLPGGLSGEMPSSTLPPPAGQKQGRLGRDGRVRTRKERLPNPDKMEDNIFKINDDLKEKITIDSRLQSQIARLIACIEKGNEECLSWLSENLTPTLEELERRVR